MDRCISQFKCFKFPISIFYFRTALFFKKQVITNVFSLNFTSIEIEGERVGSSQKEANKGGGGVKTREFPKVLFECPLMWMKNVNNFQIAKVRPQSVV